MNVQRLKRSASGRVRGLALGLAPLPILVTLCLAATHAHGQTDPRAGDQGAPVAPPPSSQEEAAPNAAQKTLPDSILRGTLTTISGATVDVIGLGLLVKADFYGSAPQRAEAIASAVLLSSGSIALLIGIAWNAPAGSYSRKTRHLPVRLQGPAEPAPVP